mmetsp:Transcript_12492/g.45544  ORF Transcript_12492/g.45544 Transcript_12492/m.45544 type:complete len:235 (+) Transcript_12492:677-1381(+)
MHKVESPKPLDITVQGVTPPETSAKRYEVKRNVPGLNASDVKVHINDRVLFIEAREGLSEAECAERDNDASATDFYMSFTQVLPDDALVEETTAYVVHGVVTIRVPQAQEAQPVNVSVVSEEEVAAEEVAEWNQLAMFRIPGYGADDVTITATHGYLKVALDRSKHMPNAKRWERYVVLPDELEDLTKVHGICDHGLLRIYFSKDGLRQQKEREVIVSGHRPDVMPQQPQDNVV